MPADWSRFMMGNVPLCSCFPAVLLIVVSSRHVVFIFWESDY